MVLTPPCIFRLQLLIPYDNAKETIFSYLTINHFIMITYMTHGYGIMKIIM